SCFAAPLVRPPSHPPDGGSALPPVPAPPAPCSTAQAARLSLTDLLASRTPPATHSTPLLEILCLCSSACSPWFCLFSSDVLTHKISDRLYSSRLVAVCTLAYNARAQTAQPAIFSTRCAIGPRLHTLLLNADLGVLPQWRKDPQKIWTVYNDLITRLLT